MNENFGSRSRQKSLKIDFSRRVDELRPLSHLISSTWHFIRKTRMNDGSKAKLTANEQKDLWELSTTIFIIGTTFGRPRHSASQRVFAEEYFHFSDRKAAPDTGRRRCCCRRRRRRRRRTDMYPRDDPIGARSKFKAVTKFEIYENQTALRRFNPLALAKKLQRKTALSRYIVHVFDHSELGVQANIIFGSTYFRMRECSSRQRQHARVTQSYSISKFPALS